MGIYKVQSVHVIPSCNLKAGINVYHCTQIRRCIVWLNNLKCIEVVVFVHEIENYLTQV